MVKSKLMKFLHQAELYNKQFENYKLIHDKANSTIRKQLNMVDKLNDYYGLTKIKNDNDIEHKKKNFHGLEVDIINVKQNSVDQQVRLNELELSIKNTIADVKEQHRRNINMNNSILSQKYVSLK